MEERSLLTPVINTSNTDSASDLVGEHTVYSPKPKAHFEFFQFFNSPILNFKLSCSEVS